jgi:hypothetical protein
LTWRKTPAYLARRLTGEENAQMAAHLASCRECREEAVFNARILRAQRESAQFVPRKIQTSAFDLIPENPLQNGVAGYLEPLFDTLWLVKKVFGCMYQNG